MLEVDSLRTCIKDLIALTNLYILNNTSTTYTDPGCSTLVCEYFSSPKVVTDFSWAFIFIITSLRVVKDFELHVISFMS